MTAATMVPAPAHSSELARLPRASVLQACEEGAMRWVVSAHQPIDHEVSGERSDAGSEQRQHSTVHSSCKIVLCQGTGAP